VRVTEIDRNASLCRPREAIRDSWIQFFALLAATAIANASIYKNFSPMCKREAAKELGTAKSSEKPRPERPDAICTGMHRCPENNFYEALDVYGKSRILTNGSRLSQEAGPIRGFTVGSVAVLPRSR
jgi:hypothetical protein